MISFLQKMIMALLVLLQFAAPLVHAHAGMEISNLGVHVPGLEALSVGTDVDKFSSISGQYHQDSCLVGISSAIPQKQDASVESSYIDSYIPAEMVFSIALNGCTINFSPQDKSLVDRLLFCLHSPRAPPRTLPL
ncbi:hypothetical protein Q9L42_004205 [Methylomarinum sp. Ch1-1]|uniref:Uncharacterized protein n=1 Tax=Methylomarinum roseum TaxID=3067653 RepID=A0AAU7NWK2_9GAMM